METPTAFDVNTVQQLLADGFAPWVQARIVRAGKSLVFGEIDIVAAGDGKSVCRVSTTYALL